MMVSRVHDGLNNAIEYRSFGCRHRPDAAPWIAEREVERERRRIERDLGRTSAPPSPRRVALTSTTAGDVVA
jgi:hypothetical protein